MNNHYCPRHVRPDSKKRLAVNTKLTLLNVLITALGAVPTWWMLIAPPTVRTIAPTQPVILCSCSHDSPHCQIRKVQSPSP